jgi:iron complex transport system substrate-binding protein
MRRILLCLILALASVALAACGGDDDDGAAGAGAAATPAATAGPEAGAYPVTIQHKYGATTIAKAPQRVVVAGLREQDAVLALGTVPVATTEWYGKHPGAVFPWAKAALGDGALPTVLSSTDGLQIEKIAAERPDLILAIYSGMTKKEYAALSRIAPVVAQPKGQVDYGSTWQQETELVGRALGKPAAAGALVAKTEKLIADTAAAHPGFRGQTAANVSDYQGIFVYGPQDARTRMLESLGFTYPKALVDAFPNDFGGQLSDEKIEAIDVGVLVWFADGERGIAKLKKAPLYKKLAVRTEGRDVFIRTQDRVYEATSFPSVLSMPTLIKELVPRLAAAADGDPATSTDEEPPSA